MALHVETTAHFSIFFYFYSGINIFAGAVAKYCNEYVCVCVCVCLSVHEDISETTRAIFTNYLCMLPMAVARSFSGVVAIRYVLPFSG